MAASYAEIFNTRDHTPEHIYGARVAKGQLSFTGTYTTGGDALTKSTLGIPAAATITSKTAVISAGSEAGILTAEYDDTNETIKLYKADGTETANGDDHTAVTVSLEVTYTE